jgi:hypothetical protein
MQVLPKPPMLAHDVAPGYASKPAFAAGLRLVPDGRQVADRLGLATWKSPEVLLRETRHAE